MGLMSNVSAVVFFNEKTTNLFDDIWSCLIGDESHFSNLSDLGEITVG